MDCCSIHIDGFPLKSFFVAPKKKGGGEGEKKRKIK
jgi:hypothetical protein